ncbi:unnamed protein product [Brassicogethes aeneus]|uniref:Malate dehydrogenase n=1 Tax=Brassicogethes aeneus TaxID=1431903 RepID=A0A9P0ANT6_BRAAE|nr:unnamed protein product [Brassicogethes aeneus]
MNIFSQVIKPFIHSCNRFFSCEGGATGFKVAIAGASGGIGQPLSMLMKINPFVKELSLFDLLHTPGVAADLSHIETPCKVKAFMGSDQRCEALKDANVIIIPAGVPRKPGMTRDDLFNVNATIIKELAEAAAEVAPKALIAIITNPLNSVVPIACEVMKKANKFDPRRIFGVTTLDIVRTNTFVADAMKINPKEVNVPVIGGHAGNTIIPLFSRSKPHVSFSDEQIIAMTKRIQNAGTEVVQAKAGAGSATLSMAYAAARFANALMRGLSGEENVMECSYVATDCGEASYFSTPLVLGKDGVKENFGHGELNDFEKQEVETAIPVLIKNIKAGVDFVNKSK